jgi:putative transposase
MPSRSRMYLPGFAYHIVQRGNNREAYFLSADCYQLYLELLKEQLSRYHVSLHTHLLMTPDCEQGISNVVKVVASRYAYLVNKQYKRGSVGSVSMETQLCPLLADQCH